MGKFQMKRCLRKASCANFIYACATAEKIQEFV